MSYRTVCVQVSGAVRVLHAPASMSSIFCLINSPFFYPLQGLTLTVGLYFKEVMVSTSVVLRSITPRVTIQNISGSPSTTSTTSIQIHAVQLRAVYEEENVFLIGPLGCLSAVAALHLVLQPNSKTTQIRCLCVCFSHRYTVFPEAYSNP